MFDASFWHSACNSWNTCTERLLPVRASCGCPQGALTIERMACLSVDQRKGRMKLHHILNALRRQHANPASRRSSDPCRRVRCVSTRSSLPLITAWLVASAQDRVRLRQLESQKRLPISAVSERPRRPKRGLVPIKKRSANGGVVAYSVHFL
jgi:hypothetical protein